MAVFGGGFAERMSFPPKMTLCAGAVVLHEQKVLLVREARGSLKGLWSIPWGFVDENEPPHRAALRETQEEAGVTARLAGLLGVQEHCPAGEQRLYLLYLAHHESGNPTPDGDETDAAGYFTESEIAQLSVEPFCQWVIQNVLSNTHTLIPQNANTPFKSHLAYL